MLGFFLSYGLKLTRGDVIAVTSSTDKKKTQQQQENKQNKNNTGKPVPIIDSCIFIQKRHVY